MNILKSSRKANQTYIFNAVSAMLKGIAKSIIYTSTAYTVSLAGEADAPRESPLFSIEATNSLESTEEVIPEYIRETTDPALIALFALDRRARTNANIRANLPTTESIGTLELPPVIAEQDIDIVVEKIRVKDILTEVENLVANDEKIKAIDKLTFELENVQYPDSKYQMNHQIGLIYYSMGKFSEAANFMELAVKLNPRDAAITCNLSAIYLYLGKVDEALDALSKISTKLLIRDKQHNMLFSTHFNYACAYALKLQKEEALAHLELSARYDPVNTLTSMSDTQLDNIRNESVFKEIRKRLDLVINRGRN